MPLTQKAAKTAVATLKSIFLKKGTALLSRTIMCICTSQRSGPKARPHRRLHTQEATHPTKAKRWARDINLPQSQVLTPSRIQHQHLSQLPTQPRHETESRCHLLGRWRNEESALRHVVINNYVTITLSPCRAQVARVQQQALFRFQPVARMRTQRTFPHQI